MSEERVFYKARQSDPGHDTIKKHSNDENHASMRGVNIVRVLDPATGRFLFEFDPGRDLIIWRERGKRVEVPLAQYR